MFRNYNISVVNLADTNKKPLIGSDRAKDFKQAMFNRNGLKRQTSNFKLKNCDFIIILKFLFINSSACDCYLKKRKFVK